MAGLFLSVWKGNWRRRIAVGSLTVLIVALIAFFAIRWLATTSIGHSFVERRVEALTVSGQSVRLDGIDGDLLGEFTIETIYVSDAEGEWLSAKNVSVAWSPWSLIRRRLNIKSVNVSEVDVMRRPVTAEVDHAGGASRPLRRYTLGDLRLDLVTLSEDVLPTPAKYQVNASLDTVISEGRLDLELSPQDPSDDKVEGRFSWGGDQPFNGQLSASGPPGGLLHQLMRLSTTSGVDVQVKGSGSPGAWKLAASAVSGEQSVFSMDASGDELSGVAEGYLELNVVKPVEEIAERLGGAVKFSARLDDKQSGDPQLGIDLDAPNLRVQLFAPVDLSHYRLDLTAISLVANSSALDQLMQIDIGTTSRLKSKGVIARTGDNWHFEGDASIAALSMAGVYAADVSGPINLVYDTAAGLISVDSIIRTRGVTSPIGALEPYLGTTPELTIVAKVDLNANQVNIPSAVLNIKAGRVTAAGQMDFDMSSLAFGGQLKVHSEAGQVSFEDGLWSVARENSSALRFGGSGKFISLDLATFSPDLFSNPSDVSVGGRIETNGEIAVSTARISGPDYTLTGQGRLRQGQISATAHAKSNAFESGKFYAESLELSAAADGTMDNLLIDFQLRPESARLAGVMLGMSDAKFSGALQGKKVSGVVDISGSFSDNAFEISGRPSILANSWSIDDIHGKMDQLLIDGEVRGFGADLTRVAGDLNFSGSLRLEEQRTALTGYLRLVDETLGADLHLAALQFGALDIQTATFRASGNRLGVDGEVNLRGNASLAGEILPNNLSMPFSFDPENTLVHVSPSGLLAGSVLETVVPVRVSLSESSRVASGKLGWLKGAIELDAQQFDEEIAIVLEAVNLSLPEAGKLFGRPGLRGTGQFDVRLSGTGDSLSGRVGAQIKDLSSGPPDTPKVDIVLDGEIKDRILTLDGKAVDMEDALSVDLTGRIPMKSSASPFVLIPRTDAIATMSLKGGGPVEGLWSLFGIPDSRFEGFFAVDADLSGLLNELKPAGQFALSKATYEDGQVGLHLKDINLAAALTESAISVTQMTARGAKGGKLSGEGRYAFDGSGKVSINVDRLDALQRDDVSAVLSGTLSVSRALSGTKVTGLLGIDRAEVDISKLPRGGYTTLDVVFPERGERRDPSDELDEVVSLDIGLRSDRRIFVNGTGLRSEWGLDAKIMGSASMPQLYGEAFIVRGDVDLVGRNFRFAESNISFNGDPRYARLNVRASRADDDWAASIVLTGTASAPEFKLMSDPDLPQDEVLARVLFGRSPAQLSAFEAAQLASGLANLSGAQSFNLMGTLQETLGVDRLDLGVSDGGEASIGAGKYIAEDIYVEVRTTTRGAPGVSVEWTPQDNLEIGTEVDPETSPRFTIKWKREFDSIDSKAPDTEQVDAE